MTSLADALPAEIERVIELRSQFEALRSLPNVIVEPQIAMMTRSINAALRAATSMDVVEMLACLKDLKEWQE